MKENRMDMVNEVHDKGSLNEYNAIRAEITTRLASENSIYLNMFIIFGTILTAVLTYAIKEVYLICIILLIPMQLRLNFTLWLIEKCSAYIRVFFETEGFDMYWETMHISKEYLENFHLIREKSPFAYIRNYTSSIMGFLIWIIYAVCKYQQIEAQKSPISGGVCFSFFLLLGFLLLICLFQVNRQYTKLHTEDMTNVIKDYREKEIERRRSRDSESVNDEPSTQNPSTPE